MFFAVDMSHEGEYRGARSRMSLSNMKYILPPFLFSLFAAPFFITDPITALLLVFILVFFVFATTQAHA